MRYKILSLFGKMKWLGVAGGIVVLTFFLYPSKCSKEEDRRVKVKITTPALPATVKPSEGDEGYTEIPPIGPVTQEEFNQVMDAGQYDRIMVGAAFPDDAGTGTFGVSIRYFDDPNEVGGPHLTHDLDKPHLYYFASKHYIYYNTREFPTQEVLALFNLMREKNFLNLNVTKDPNAGPDRYQIVTSIYHPPVDYTVTSTMTNVRDTSTPDNAAFFEVIDFLRSHFVTWAMNNYWCRVEHQNGELISQYGSDCPTLP